MNTTSESNKINPQSLLTRENTGEVLLEKAALITLLSSLLSSTPDALMKLGLNKLIRIANIIKQSAAAYRGSTPLPDSRMSLAGLPA